MGAPSDRRDLSDAERAARDELVLAHAGWARALALKTRRVLNLWSISEDEAIAAVHFALIRVASRYVPDGRSFRSFACHRLQRSILDESYVVGGVANGGEKTRRKFLELAGPTTLERLPSHARGPDAIVQDRQVRRMLAGLPYRLRQVLTMRHLEGLSFVEIGAYLGISEARVFQLEGEALALLRDRFVPPASPYARRG